MPQNNRTPSLDRPPVAILEIGRNFISIGRDPYEAIADEPFCEANDRPTGKLPLTLRALVDPLGPRRSRRRRVILHVGLLERVKDMLEAVGRRVRIRPAGPLQFVTPHRRPDDSDWRYSEVLRQAYGRRCTLAEVRSLDRRLGILAEWRDQFPELHLLIVVKNKSWARAIAAELSHKIDSPVSWGGGERSTQTWTHVDGVSTFPGRSYRDWTLVAFLDAELVRSQTALDQLTAMAGSVRLGFLTRDERELPTMDRAILECIFGPVIFRDSQIENATAVAVAWLDSPSDRTLEARNRLQAKRDCIWHNDARNRLVAGVASAFERADRAALRRHGLGEAVDWISQAHSFVGHSVMIVVETVEHGRELQKQLPDWQLRATSLRSGEELEPVLGTRSIVTLSRASKSFVTADVVVYAAATGERWPESHGPQGELLGGGRMLVVDVADDHDRELARQTQCRAGDYRHRKWRVFSGEPRALRWKGGAET